nr:plastin-3-like [Lytechinus pictus]
MDEMDEIREYFDKMDLNKDGFLTDKEIQEILQAKGESVPAYKCRDFIREYDTDNNGRLTFNEFMKLYDDIKKNKVSSRFLTQVKARVGIQAEKGTSEVSAAGTTHSFSKEETAAFTRYINEGLNFRKDPALASKLPISVDGGLFEAVVDGILLCKMINSSVANTIDERVITTTKLNKFTQLENLTLALNSAKAIGCSVINIDPMDIQNKTKHLVLGLVWQIIRIGLFANIDLQFRPELILLLNEGEELEDLKKLSPEELLIRWVNYHLEQDGSARRIKNFSEDIKDSEVYYCLMRQIAPKDIALHYTLEHNRSSLDARAEDVLKNAELLDCRAFVTSKDIVSGNSKLNMAFVANLFNHHHGLVPTEEMDYENIEETREEKTYRNWMNSLNVKPYVNHLYSDLSNGLVLLELFDIVKPGIVNWEKVNRPPYKMAAKMKKIENCNYCVELGREMKFSLVGIGGQDICDGVVTLTLGKAKQKFLL